MYFTAIYFDTVTTEKKELQYTVFFSDGAKAEYETLDELINGINHTNFVKVIRYHYVFSSKMWLREDVTRGIRNILVYENGKKE